MHASHWSDKINSHRLVLRRLVLRHLHTNFERRPCLALAESLKNISFHDTDTQEEINDVLTNVATYSSENFAAALDIYSSQNNTSKIATLLETHAYLLRPKDTMTYQLATIILSQTPRYLPRALKIIETELNNLIDIISAGIESIFTRLDEEQNQKELTLILKLNAGSPQRPDRIVSWVKAISSPSVAPAHPMAFAAMMMGFVPPIVEEGEDADVVDFLTLHMSDIDPDLSELDEELRPRLRQRFDGWQEMAGSLKGGNALLLKFYTETVERMPYLRALDVTEEMVSQCVWLCLVSVFIIDMSPVGCKNALRSTTLVMPLNL